MLLIFDKETDNETDKALDVKDSKRDADTPIIALPISGNTSQKWKYSTVPSVSINVLCSCLGKFSHLSNVTLSAKIDLLV